jgi:hypothetical protein
VKSNTPTVKNIMVQYGLTLEAVSQRACCTMVETYKALHLQHFRMCPLIIITRVRRAIEDALYERGWNGQREQLWSDFDAMLKKYLQGNCTAPQRRSRTRHAISR